MKYNSYKSRMLSYGVDRQDAVSAVTKRAARNQIINSPTRKEVKVNDKESNDLYCVVNDIKDLDVRQFLFMPDTPIDRGDYIFYGDYTYLVTTQTTNKEFPEVEAGLCTTVFPIKDEDQEVVVNIDDWGRPITETITGEVIFLPCIVKMNDASTAIADVNESVNMLDNQIKVTIPYRESPSIEHDKRFTIYNESYRIIRIDPSKSINGKGLLTVTGERMDRSEVNE